MINSEVEKSLQCSIGETNYPGKFEVTIKNNRILRSCITLYCGSVSTVTAIYIYCSCAARTVEMYRFGAHNA